MRGESGSAPDAQAMPAATSDPAAEPPPQAAPAVRTAGRVGAFAGRYAVVLALLALIVVFSLLRPDTFFTTGNLQSILVTESVLVILALGLLVPLASGEFDL